MSNVLTYGEISEICKKKKISLTTLADKVGMTLRGFREGYNKKTIGIQALVSICKTLGMTPNELLGWSDEEHPTYQQVQNGGKNNQQQMTTDVELLRDQLSVKDRQIEQLLNLLNRK
jgi:DNA-binding Xre family transcriptional regulator